MHRSCGAVAGPPLTRRTLLAGASALALAGPVRAALPRAAAVRVKPVPATFVTLQPSIFRDAFDANRRYLLSLDPERLLHNFYRSAGLPAPKPTYPGWEGRGIAGHSLGHWLSGNALTVVNTNDPAVAAALDHALAEMARIQDAHGDGYLGGTTVDRDGRTIDGKIVFEEVRRGEIRSQGFDLNDGWVPLYTWHKVHAGLLDAHRLAGNPRALPIALKLAGYLAGVLEPLDDAQMQRVLAAEHGGLNDAYAETYALTGDPRWRRMAEKIRHKAVLDPLTAQQDRLAGLHANTQIPKLIGLARLYEVTGDPRHATAARFFYDRVTQHHSYVIGGNSEREHFGQPDQIASRITEKTCESCNSYNMMKLARHLYGWEPRADWFDYYERAQLNHIMAHQRPDTGQFAYFVPLSTGARRVWSTPDESFWCCVGSGMESHAKHADSIYWSDAATLYVNLYIPSRLDWAARGLALDLETAMPVDGRVALRLRRAPRAATTLALRLPSWAQEPVLRLNGEAVPIVRRDGYAIIARRWRAGDRVELDLPMTLRAEPAPGDPATVAFVSGPLVLAADVGPAARPFDRAEPALLTAGDAAGALRPGDGPHRYRAASATGGELAFAPFFAQYDRRSAVYFPTFSAASWASEGAAFRKASAERQALARRTVDTVFFGEMQPERDHDFVTAGGIASRSHTRTGRRLPPGTTMRVTLARRPGASILRVVYWGADLDRDVAIRLDGAPFAVERPSGPAKQDFVAIDYPVPARAGATTALVEFNGRGGLVEIFEATMLDAVGDARAMI